jgi:hypothetical protein
MWSTPSSCHILIILGFSRQDSEKSSTIKFNWNTSSGSRVAGSRKTEMTKLVDVFRNFVNAPTIRKKKKNSRNISDKSEAPRNTSFGMQSRSTVQYSCIWLQCLSNELVHVAGRAPRNMAVNRAMELLLSACLFVPVSMRLGIKQTRQEWILRCLIHQSFHCYRTQGSNVVKWGTTSLKYQLALVLSCTMPFFSDIKH